jgi:hypothetical protein
MDRDMVFCTVVTEIQKPNSSNPNTKTSMVHISGREFNTWRNCGVYNDCVNKPSSKYNAARYDPEEKIPCNTPDRKRMELRCRAM